MRLNVIGAGLSGLTLAAGMKQLAPATQIAIYERDESAFSRGQGYAIGLRFGFGLAALAELGLRDATVGQDSVKVTTFAILDQRGNRLLSLPSGEHGPNTTYRVQREHLKRLLLDAVGDTPINYSKHCTGFEQSGVSAVARFEDGSQAEADYIVACDGAGSTIRQQIVGDQKRYLGLNSIHCESRLDAEHPFLAGGYFLMLGDRGTSLFCYRQPGGVYWSYVLHAQAENETADRPPPALLEQVHKETATWHELARKIVAASMPDTIGVRGYYDKQPLTHVHHGRVWMIGDAAHPMSPFQGQGANMAIMDAVRLARYFGAGASPELAAKLEQDIAKRGRKHVQDSRANATRFHETRAWGQAQRNFAFRVGDLFIRIFSRAG